MQNRHLVRLQRGDNEVVNVTGLVQSKIALFLLNLKYWELRPTRIMMSRHGKSQYNLDDRIGGDSDLCEEGRQYVVQLDKYLQKSLKGKETPSLLTSHLQRACSTAGGLHLSPTQGIQHLQALDEIDAGICDSISYAELAEYYPQIKQARAQDKLNYRYPQGESYQDMIHRLDGVVLMLEKEALGREVVIIGHQANLRCLYGYLMAKDIQSIPTLDMPLHTLITL